MCYALRDTGEVFAQWHEPAKPDETVNVIVHWCEYDHAVQVQQALAANPLDPPTPLRFSGKRPPIEWPEGPSIYDDGEPRIFCINPMAGTSETAARKRPTELPPTYKTADMLIAETRSGERPEG
jgi:hypothetical protein